MLRTEVRRSTSAFSSCPSCDDVGISLDGAYEVEVLVSRVELPGK